MKKLIQQAAGGLALGVVLAITLGPVAWADGTPTPGPVPTIDLSGAQNVPGYQGIVTGLNTLAIYVAILCGVAFVAALGSILIGNAFHIHQLVQGGKVGILVSLLVAFGLGLITVILNFAFSLGKS